MLSFHSVIVTFVMPPKAKKSRKANEKVIPPIAKKSRKVNETAMSREMRDRLLSIGLDPENPAKLPQWFVESGERFDGALAQCRECSVIGAELFRKVMLTSRGLPRE